MPAKRYRKRQVEVHELKCWPPYFEHVLSGRKTFEVRSIEDRTFAVGDRLKLREYDGSLAHNLPETNGYTGRECERTITYVLGDGDFGIKPGFVALGLATYEPVEEGGGEDLKQADWRALAAMEREGREAAEEKRDDLHDALVERNDRVIELERRCVELRRQPPPLVQAEADLERKRQEDGP